ncbi:glycosyltransferase family 4 protein [Pokkaliibacter plantistimulans]|uniref:glycosyltransferase family 4 protein n=1 Tax=Pokkaliibacter plantistimulans TaxID=1635171 RepID=UPI001A9C5925|nr:glycosyltransferase family 4 protein [Pokkaliibacter plantistimulans]
MIKLAIIRQQYRPDGGAERFVSRALELLSQRSELDVSIVSRQWLSDASSPFHSISCNPPKRGRISKERDFNQKALQILAENNFDIVQSHERIPGCTLYRAGDGVHREWLNQRARILSPLARWWQERDPYHRYVLNTEREMFTHPELRAVICNSQMVKNDILRHFDIDPAKLHVIYNGVDTSIFNPNVTSFRVEYRQRFGIPAEAPCLLFVGSGFLRKGLMCVLRAMAESPRKDLHLIVVGRDKQQRQYQHFCEKHRFANRIHFVGVQKDVRPYYGAADVLVHPALYDPFPNVIWEALACGLPIITSSSCGGAELIEHGAPGLVIDALDHKALSLHFEPLREARERQAPNLIDHISDTSLEQCLLQLYRNIANHA